MSPLKNENGKKKFFDPMTSSAEPLTFWVMHNIRVKKKIHNGDLLGIKRRRISRRIQKYKLSYVKNAQEKSF